MENHDYIEAIRRIKAAILQSRYMAAHLANAEQLKLYFNIGAYVSANSRNQNWGSAAIEIISEHLQIELPGLRGFSPRSIKYMRSFYDAWSKEAVNFLLSPITNNGDKDQDNLITKYKSTNYEIRQLPIAELADGNNRFSSSTNVHKGRNDAIMIDEEKLDSSSNEMDANAFLAIGFTHHITLLEKCKEITERWYYIKRCASEFWSVELLKAHIKADDYRKIGTLPNNFALTLPDANQAAKAVRTFKDEYLLDYINIEDTDTEQDIDEPELNKVLVREVKKFIQTLGHDFCYISNGYRVIEEDEESFIDLLFFQRSLKCLVAIELKRGKFKPAYLGQLNYYLSVLDDKERHADENPSIGLILCREVKRNIVELAIRDFGKPMGVATYRLGGDIPKDFSSLEPLVSGIQKILDRSDECQKTSISSETKDE